MRPMAGLAPRVIALHVEDGDQDEFVEQVGAIVDGVVRELDPPQVHVIKIDSWFSQRWHGFSGKVLGAVPLHDRVELRVPPFIPSRVISQRDYVRAEGGGHARCPEPRIHIYQTSADNLRRVVSDMYPGAALFWWSGATRAHGRGSLMAYVPHEPVTVDKVATAHSAWYAELARAASGSWRVSKTVGVSPVELERWGPRLD
jgi:hypothetical protein